MAERNTPGGEPYGSWNRFVRPAILLLVVGVGLWLFLGRADEEPVENKDGTSASAPARLVRLTVDSRALGQDMPVNVIDPPHGKESSSALGRRGALVFLHGRGSDQTSVLSSALYVALREMGSDAPVIIAPYGGDSSYYHDRESGDWPEYVMSEVLDEARNGVLFDRGKLAIGGISMGGFGALNVASTYPDRFCAVGAHSPAIFTAAGETAPDAFDDAADFEVHDLVSRFESNPNAMGDVPIWIDIGDVDPFLPGTQSIINSLNTGGATLTSNVWPGDHNSAYWDSHWDEYLDFYASELDKCELTEFSDDAVDSGNTSSDGA